MSITLRTATRAAVAALALITATPATQAGVSLVQNGSFESNGGMGQMAGGITYATGWTTGASAFNFIGNNTADSAGLRWSYSGLLGNLHAWGPNTPVANGGPVNNGFSSSPDGGYALVGGLNNPTSAVSQTINGLVVGSQYSLSFEWAQSQMTNYSVSTTSGWRASLGGESHSTATPTLAGKGFGAWTAESFTFTATGTTETLSFLPIGAMGAGAAALLDGVSLTQVAAVPEPGTMAMGLIVCGLAGVAARRKARRVAVVA